MKKFALISMAIVFAVPALAGYRIRATGDQQQRSGVIKVHSPVDGEGGSNSYRTYTGIFKFDIHQNGSLNTQLPDGRTSYFAVCVDLSEYIDRPDNFEIVDASTIPQPEDLPWQPMGNERETRLSQLFAAHWDDVFDAQGNVKADESKAFQLAAWEIVYEGSLDTNGDMIVPSYGSYSVGSGSFSATQNNGSALSNSWTTLANNWLNGLTANSATTKITGLHAYDGGQDFVTIGVPVPGAALLGILGLSIAGWTRRRLA